ncbi:NAD-dependent epimerase/dehydratase family protein [Bradyrhizobium sp. HKCCYLRH3099]|uniref:NAD-dependent epimerase/dehydratase family protein n=1 Tax=unclassified Bradyrhizobium TaxID=2631580 RepID=UPI003EB6E0D5
MSTSPSASTVLVLGLTGAIGGAIAKALARRGFLIRALTRRPAAERPSFGFPVEWRDGDARDAAALRLAAEGASLIVHGVNPPGYARWREDALPMLANSIAAAKAVGATIVFPGNVYVYSSASPAVVSETTPRQPTTRKGQVRLEMEEMLEQAAREHGVRVIAIRAGDFFGPGVTNSWFAQALAKGGMAATSVQRLTRPGIGHAWAYVPDLAEAFARLVDIRADLPNYTMLNFAGHYDATGHDMTDAVRRVLGRADLPVKSFPWIILWLAAPFVRFMREAIEMRWLWKQSLALDNTRLVGLLGAEPHTRLDEAVRTALDPAIARESQGLAA